MRSTRAVRERTSVVKNEGPRPAAMARLTLRMVRSVPMSRDGLGAVELAVQAVLS